MAIRAAIVGAGETAISDHLPAYESHDGVDLVAVSDIDANKSKKIAEEFDIPRFYGSPENLFEECDLDVVSICTPPRSHFSIAKEAVNKGCSFLCEKPTTLSIDNAAKLCELVEDRDLVASGGYKFQFHPNFYRAIQQIDNEIIGGVREVRGSFYGKLPEKDWKLSPEQAGGGVFMQLLPHLLSYLLRIVEGDLRIDGASIRRWGTSNIEADGTVEGTIGSTDFHFSTGWRPYNGPTEIHIFGEDGNITVNLSREHLNAHEYNIEYSKAGLPWIDIPSLAMMFRRYQEPSYKIQRVTKFLDAVVGRGQNLAPLSDSLQILPAIQEAYNTTGIITPLNDQ